jgi:hypothetical protein
LSAEVVASVEQAIEDEIDKSIRPAVGERSLEGPKVAHPLAVQCADFIVDETIGQMRAGLRNFGETARPVEPFAGAQAYVAIGDAHLDAVTVEFDLVNPIRTDRWRQCQTRESRRDEDRDCFAARFSAVEFFLILMGRMA